jgi:energy-coupling factor transport system ATP-binding protein
MLVLLETVVPFLLAFEGGRPQTRRLAVTAVLCALAVAGRAAFFMLPSFKPVLAIVIISGAAYGGETGFLVGAVSMLASNILFGQGPWTPWQMLGMGLSGFLAGVIFSGRLRPEKAALCVFGALAALLVYGPTVNFASALIWQPNLNWGMVLAALASGLPFDLIHAGATVIFLWLGAEPMLRKLERMETKYGVMSQTAGKLC